MSKKSIMTTKCKNIIISLKNIGTSVIISIISVFLFINITGFSWFNDKYEDIHKYFPEEDLEQDYEDVVEECPNITYEKFKDYMNQIAKKGLIKDRLKDKSITSWEILREFLFSSEVKQNDSCFVKIYKIIGNSIKESNQKFNGSPVENPIFIRK